MHGIFRFFVFLARAVVRHRFKKQPKNFEGDRCWNVLFIVIFCPCDDPPPVGPSNRVPPRPLVLFTTFGVFACWALLLFFFWRRDFRKGDG